MFVRASSGSSGGNSDPVYLCLQVYHGYYNTLFPSNFFKNFKHVEILSAAKWYSETGASSVSGVVPTCTLKWSGSANYTLSVDTPFDLSSLNIPDNVTVSIIGNEASGWAYLPIKLSYD